MTDQPEVPAAEDETPAPESTPPSAASAADSSTSETTPEAQAVEAEEAVAGALQSPPTALPVDDPSKQPADGPSAGPAEEAGVPQSEAAEPPASSGDEATAKAPQPAIPGPPAIAKPEIEERPEVRALRSAQEQQTIVDGKVIGWNSGGLHVVVNGITAFCPRSEIETGTPKEPQSYVDKTLPFVVLRVQKRGRRIIVSRRAIQQRERDTKLDDLRQAFKNGEILQGTVSSLTDFGAFVDLGGIDGLVHVSEISRSRVAHPSEVLSEGDSVKVRVLKIGDGGKRVSLSMKALEPDPWNDIEKRFPAGDVIKGTVERIAEFGAFVEVAPGLTGLLPTSAMNLPRDASPARIYQPGKEITVQVISVDKRRRRISLALEGSQVEGTRADLKSYKEKQTSSGGSFGALAAAFEKARRRDG